ncbi:unnamed protein product [Cyclocybe aegerita]|uniref:Carbonic anhydrase n=1 Tax=Cyclocybe aegerita TaxID=1973307 RepID=A0A8S0W322_CYCAE|nr:unnamed protein product [Cyclocybe aegerita]
MYGSDCIKRAIVCNNASVPPPPPPPPKHYEAFRDVCTRPLALLPLSSVTAHSTPLAGHRTKSTCKETQFFPEILELFKGNEEYMAEMANENPGLLATLATEGQKPPFMLVDCSDSRVNEQGIFSAKPGTMFTAGNIANQFDEADLNSNAVLSFAVGTLKVKHVVVMGHYGCGGVAASMVTSSTASPADIAVNTWIQPIRQIYLSSTRPEIAEHRRNNLLVAATTPDLHDPTFRALVEENVKANVQKIANSLIIRSHYASIVANSSSAGDIFIHGWVYDVENGKVSDLDVSVGPPGRAVPPSPFPVLKTH